MKFLCKKLTACRRSQDEEKNFYVFEKLPLEDNVYGLTYPPFSSRPDEEDHFPT